tara:strand:- start:366 stop:572 length:207 start_codon:yes stop_codon:yes gene_type:complete
MLIKWFTLNTRDINIERAAASAEEVILFETLNEVSNFSTSTVKTNLYVRIQFITGEQRSKHVFSLYQQ